MDKFRRDLSLQSNAAIVVVKSGDEYLKVGRHHRKMLLVTQSYVDKSITDEIAQFVIDSYEEKPVPLEPKIIVPEPSTSNSLQSSSKTPIVKPKYKYKKKTNGGLVEPNQSLEGFLNHNGNLITK